MRKLKIKAQHAYQGFFEPLERVPSYELRSMFGCKVACVHGKQSLVITAQKNRDWNGMLVCTSREHHDSLIAEFPALGSHPILGKWLYVSADDPLFEETADALVRRAIRGDERIGIEGNKRSRTRKKTVARKGPHK